MLGPQEKILRKISSTTSMHEFNIMRRNIEQMYESSVYNTSHESLLANLERFIKSTNTMTHTVMIPSRLMDLQIDEIAISDKLLSDVCHLPHPNSFVKCRNGCPGLNGGTIDEDASSISSCDSSSSFDQISPALVYSNGTTTSNSNNNNGPMVTSLDHQRQPPSPPLAPHRAMSKCGSTSTIANVDHSNKLDMYTAYKLLVTARNDLVWSSTLEEESFVVNGAHDGETDDLDYHPHTQHILMVKFKHHLDALNELMAQFADLAEALTHKYEMHENMD